MEHVLIGVYPGMQASMLQFMVSQIKEFVRTHQ